MPYPILITLSSARSGTTFCYSLINIIYNGFVRVEHEIIKSREARLREFFRCYEAERISEAYTDKPICNLISEVEKSSFEKPVMIFGFTVSHLAPIFIDKFGEQVRLLHLYRNPILQASSVYVMTNPDWWKIPPYGVDPYSDKLTPFDPHIRFKSFRSRWKSMGLFEIILYQWLERHSFAI